MKRISILVALLILILAWGWMVRREASTSSATQSPVVSYTTVPMSYMDAASALAQDDFAKAKQSLAQLAEESRGDLQARARHAAEASDIDAMREAFKTLSENAALNMSYPADYAVAYCSMYKGGSKWLQKRDAPIANPYLGKAGAACGSFVD